MRDRAAAAAAPEGASCRRGLLTTAEDRGVDDPDWLLIRDIVEDPGLPVRKDRVAGLMRARGSAVTDDEFARMMNQVAGVLVAASASAPLNTRPRSAPGIDSMQLTYRVRRASDLHSAIQTTPQRSSASAAPAS